MERDLALIRLKRAERDKVQGAIRTQDSSHEEGATPQNESEKNSNRDPSLIGSLLKRTESDDVIMIDAMDERETFGNSANENSQPVTAPNKSGLEHVTLASSKTAQVNINPGALAISIDPSASTKTNSLKASLKASDNPDSQPNRPVETPTTASLRESDFETMFNDIEDVGETQAVNFDLGIAIGADGLDNTGFGGSTAKTENPLNLTSTSNEDINTLLPGLENYVNASDDFSIINPATGATLPKSTSAGATDTSAPQALESVAVESNFDDLFSSSNFVDNSGDYDMDGSGDISDFKEFDHSLNEWFK